MTFPNDQHPGDCSPLIPPLHPNRKTCRARPSKQSIALSPSLPSGRKPLTICKPLSQSWRKTPQKTLRDALHSGRRVFSAQSPASENQSGDGESSHTTIRVIQPGKSFNIFSSCMNMPSATLDSIHYICGDEFDQERVIYEWCEKETKGQNPASIEIRYQADTRCHFAPEIRRRRPIRPTAFIA